MDWVLLRVLGRNVYSFVASHQRPLCKRGPTVGSRSAAGPGAWSALLRETASRAPVPDRPSGSTGPGGAGQGRAGAEGGLQACFTSAVCWGLVDVDATSGCSPSFALCELHGSSKGCVDLLMNGVSESLPRWRGAWLWAGGGTLARLCTHPKKRVVQCSDLRRHSRVIYLFC